MDALLELLNDNLWVILGCAAGGFLGLLLSWNELRKIFRMLGTSTGEIASLPADEQVEVSGKADGETALQSPITKTSCVFWQVIVSERRRSGKSSHWYVVQNKTSTTPFDVYDGTGRMRVYPSWGMELLLHDDVKKSSGIFSSLDAHTEAVLKEMGVDTKGFLNMNKNMRVQERYIEQGDQIYLLGKTSAQAGARTIGAQNSPFIVSDHSELRLIGTFSWKVFVNSLLGVFIGAMLAFYFMNR